MERTHLKFSLFFFLLLWNKLPLSSQLYDYGLHLVSYPAKATEMSSLVLENNQPLLLKGETSISFKMNIRDENPFGTVFRIVTDTGKNIDLYLSIDDGKRFPIFVTGEMVHPVMQEIIYNKWIPITITFSSENNEVSLLYGMTQLSVPYPVSESNSIRMAFGQCNFEGFNLPDLASINLKDIEVKYDKKLSRFWKLEKHSEDICYDSLQHIPALATNPQWIIDRYVSWRQVCHYHINELSSFAFNPNTCEFYIYSAWKNELQIYNTLTHKLRNIEVKKGFAATKAPGRLYYDTETDKLISYNLHENKVSFFSFATNEWSYLQDEDTDFMVNNSVIYNPEEKMLLSFGGYNFYKYNNDIIKVKPYQQTLERISLPEIDPRYSPSTTIHNNTLYIFGGRGSKSGRQELSPHNYYDLYAVDLTTWKSTEIWGITSVIDEFLPSENMLYDEENKCFYALANYQNGRLLKIDPTQDDIEPMSLPLHTSFAGQYLYTNLYYSPKQKLMYALIHRSEKDHAEVEIHSLTYPPIPLTILTQDMDLTQKEKPSVSIGWYIGSVLFIVTLAFTFILVRTKRKNPGKKNKKRTARNRQAIHITNVQPDASDQDGNMQSGSSEIPQYYDFSKSSICILGGFLVKDRDGNDITEQFTPLLKHLFVLLLMHTVQNPKGISGMKLIQYLWNDKTEESAKKNRNVYLSKLRIILSKVGNIEIINKTTFWSISIGKDVICDYVEAMNCFAAVKEQKEESEEKLYRLQELLLCGPLLPNTEADWLDNFKSNFSNLTLDILLDLYQKDENHLSDDYKLRIADKIFLHDFINEEALFIKCSILCKNGKKGLARNVYDNFCKEYYNLMGAKYKYSLSEVISRDKI